MSDTTDEQQLAAILKKYNYNAVDTSEAIAGLLAWRRESVLAMLPKPIEFPHIPDDVPKDSITDKGVQYAIKAMQFNYEHAGGFNAAIDQITAALTKGGQR